MPVEQGGAKLYDAVNNAMSRITEKAGSSGALYDNSVLGQDIERLNRSISLAEERLLKLEERYYRQFTAMEQAINRMNPAEHVADPDAIQRSERLNRTTAYKARQRHAEAITR